MTPQLVQIWNIFFETKSKTNTENCIYFEEMIKMKKIFLAVLYLLVFVYAVQHLEEVVMILLAVGFVSEIVSEFFK